ncbi:nucleoside hydrolase [Naasia sp. SYSU D00057]|uniref:nucleoside hydrolase n=1 Tax=Naasia sp. SYSU D00057 TaxID=2817380 RepID=UPI001B300DC0|nr:nucleoside hydrolase [Naasia sp. SYSU D00057]
MGPRYRVIIDNDFSGDPDDLFQLAHHVLSPSVEIPFVIGSHLAPGDFFDPSDRQAENAADIARELLRLLDSSIPVLAGSNVGLADAGEARPSAASDAIVREAMRDDTDLPLFLALGAGLTELASALLTEPRIADRLTAVWIGGPEHEGIGLPFPLEGRVEYNLAIDIPAAQTVFNDFDVPIWQVPRNTYRQALVSTTELEMRVRPHGPLGRRLADSIADLTATAAGHGLLMGETYALGDQPLVLLTALHSSFEADPSSSDYVTVPTPRMTEAGWYEDRPDGRPMRVYSRLDTRLMFEDMYLKLERFASTR